MTIDTDELKISVPHETMHRKCYPILYWLSLPDDGFIKKKILPILNKNQKSKRGYYPEINNGNFGKKCYKGSYK